MPDEIKEQDNVTIHERNANPASSITFAKDATIENSEEVPLGEILEVDVDDAGNVYIIEFPMRSEGIYVYNSEGTFISKIGRNGRGPGEFQALIDIDIAGDQIFTLDAVLLRIQVFSTETHNLIHEANLDRSQWNLSGEQNTTFPEKIYVLNDSTFLGVFKQINSDVDTRSYYHIDVNGNISSERLMSQDFSRKLETTTGGTLDDPFGGRGLMAISVDKQIYTTWSEEMMFKVYNSDGTYVRAFYHPFDKSNLSNAEAQKFYDSNALPNKDIPDTWRLFEHIIIDDKSNLWISTITDDSEMFEWWIMDRYGNLGAKFKWPQRKEIKKIKNGFAYVLETEAETGLQEVIKYRFQWSD